MSQSDRQDEWDALRIGKISASHIHEVLAKGSGITRDKYMIRLIKERLTGVIESDGYQSKQMTWGVESEDEARMAYFGETMRSVTEVLFVDHPTIPMFGCSPDGLVEADGNLEIKCRDSHNHIKYLLDEGKIDRPAMLQTQTQMVVTGRSWTDYVHYDNRFPVGLDLHIYRVPADAVVQNEICLAVIQFEADLQAKLSMLKKRLTVNR